MKRSLQVRYRWKEAAQFTPISPAMFEVISQQADVHALPDRWVKERRITLRIFGTEDRDVDAVRVPAGCGTDAVTAIVRFVILSIVFGKC